MRILGAFGVLAFIVTVFYSLWAMDRYLEVNRAMIGAAFRMVTIIHPDAMERLMYDAEENYE